MSNFLPPSTPARHTIPQAEDKSNTNGNHRGQWGTPQARDWKGGEGRSKASETGTDLPSQVVRNWTTPISRDCYEIAMAAPLSERQDGRSRMDTMPRQVHHQGKYMGKLNPRWVETLMGLPIGWTMPSCAEPVIIALTSSDSLGMESSPTPQREPSASCGETWPTPPASQRGEDLTAYLRKCIKRMKAGGAPFAPTLQVATEAPAVSTDFFKDLDLMRETEDLILEIKQAMNK